jgi:hypothetical protein
MSVMQRRKGQTGERELHAKLSAALGITVRRLARQRDGDPDGLDLPGWAIEVKRVERPQVLAWWTQTLDQAHATGRRPLLAYRASRRPWRCVLRLDDVAPGRYAAPDGESPVECDLSTAAAVIRETL